MNDWKIRRAAPADARCIAQHRYFNGEPPQDLDAYAAWLVPRIEAGTYVGVVAEGPQAVVAGAGAVLLDWGPTRGEPSTTRARIVNVFTNPHWRGRGIARSLVEGVMDACAGQGVRVFCLAASADAAGMYRSLGFARSEHEMVLRRSC